jgi:hypothetical protein
MQVRILSGAPFGNTIMSMFGTLKDKINNAYDAWRSRRLSDRALALSGYLIDIVRYGYKETKFVQSYMMYDNKSVWRVTIEHLPNYKKVD